MGKTEVLNTIDEQIDILTETIHSKDLQENFRGNFWNLIQAIIFKDPEAAVESGLSSMQILFHMPTAMFWTKMERYLKGTFGKFEILYTENRIYSYLTLLSSVNITYLELISYILNFLK